MTERNDVPRVEQGVEAGDDVVDDVVEEPSGVAAAADDDSPLPPERLDLGAGDDGDTPRFREP